VVKEVAAVAAVAAVVVVVVGLKLGLDVITVFLKKANNHKNVPN